MCTFFPIWDISYLTAATFVLGSVLWCLNAFFVFLPFLVPPAADFPGESLIAGGITACIGATIFEIGSVFLMLEAVNENRVGCFGWAVERLYDSRTTDGGGEEAGEGEEGEGEGKGELQVAFGKCTHHHRNRRNLVGKPAGGGMAGGGDADADPTPRDTPRSWTWWPSRRELREHYRRELGFWACAAQMAGATVFWIAGFTALPGVLDHLSPGLADGVYWTPQVVGGCGFIVSGTLFMLETQERWWKPALRTLGWHIGLWNLIGGVGFTLSPAFGYAPAHWAQYQAACSTFWGSWAFMVGSVLQWYESLEKHPVEVDKEVRRS